MFLHVFLGIKVDSCIWDGIEATDSCQHPKIFARRNDNYEINKNESHLCQETPQVDFLPSQSESPFG